MMMGGRITATTSAHCGRDTGPSAWGIMVPKS
jgi:hypothetical protein